MSFERISSAAPLHSGLTRAGWIPSGWEGIGAVGIVNEPLLQPFPFIHFFSPSIPGFSGALGGQVPDFSCVGNLQHPKRCRGWHCQALHALLHPLPTSCPVELEFLSSLPWEIHPGAVAHSNWEGISPASFNLSAQPSNPWMQPLLGSGILWPLWKFHLLLLQGCS